MRPVQPLAELLHSVPGVLSATGDLQTLIAGITGDSRQVVAGFLFVGYRGVGADGHRFIADAVARGAAAVVGEKPRGDGWPVPYVQVADGRAALAWLNAAWYGHPSCSMALVGVTGTDGKTTTANLLFNILRAAGRRTGLISTVNAVIGDEVYDTGLHTTTPDASDVQRLLAQMQAAGTEAVVLETTSHGLVQHRVTGCVFDVAVITNVTHEHLDYHGSFEAYRDAKALLFRSLAGTPRKPGVPKAAVLNRDDRSYAYLASIPAECSFTYGMGEEGDTKAQGVETALSAWNVQSSAEGTHFLLQIDYARAVSPPDRIELVSPLLGLFNIYNIMAACAAGLALSVGLESIRSGVAGTARIPGRMERIDRGQLFCALVDFAHTPYALARALETARGLAASEGRVIVVFGCAGLRDREKRSMMGQEAARLADFAVVTAEDPRTEDLDAIIDETAQAMLQGGRQEGRDFVREPDRQRAILIAVRMARAGDVVIACGKGHEQSMCFGTVEQPWRDQHALAWALDLTLGAPAGKPPFHLPTWREA